MGSTHDREVEAVVAGAGVAGCVAAAALSDAGFSVLLVEPGQKAERRLAGELLHPPGVAGLRALGFALPEAGADAARVQGFAVFHDHGSGRPPNLLSYRDSHGRPDDGVALSHAALRDCLVAQVRARPGVTVLTEARVVDLDLDVADRPVAILRHAGGSERVRARLMVAADGAASQVRTRAGIGHRRRRLSTLLGFMGDSGALPSPGYGHLFLAASRPVLAYATGQGQARIMVDLPLVAGESRDAQLAEALAMLPPALKAEAERGLRNAALSHVSQEVSVETIARGRVVLVGDAGGSCHPLTATGMTVAVADGLCLRAALRDSPDELGRALALYRRRRRGARRTRRLVASGLYESCSATGPEAALMRRGLERYWREDARGRAASMALLTMADVGLLSALREMVGVVLHGSATAEAPGRPRLAWAMPLLNQPRLALGVAGLMARHIGAAAWSP